MALSDMMYVHYTYSDKAMSFLCNPLQAKSLTSETLSYLRYESYHIFIFYSLNLISIV